MNNLNKRKFTLNEDQMNLIKEAFDLFDMEKTGTIDYHELKLTLKAFGFNMKKAEIKSLIEQEEAEKKFPFDNLNKTNNKPSRLSFEKFIDIMTTKFSERNPRDEAIMAFDLFDEEKKGKISLKNLKKVVKEINENLSENELKAIIEEFDTDHDGFITKEDFLKIMDEYYFD
jgi:centrin-3